MGQVVATLELSINDSRLPVNSNDTPPTQDNTGDDDDNSNGAAAAYESSVVYMPDAPKKKVDISINTKQKDSKISPKKAYSSLLTPQKSPIKIYEDPPMSSFVSIYPTPLPTTNL